MKKKKVACLGYWAGWNYGSELTNFAIYSFLKNRYDVKMVDICLDSRGTKISAPRLFKNNPYNPENLYGRYVSKKELKDVNEISDIFIANSDQQLNYEVYKMTGETACLDFITKNKKIIYYAASFGFDKFYGPEKDRAKMSYFLRQFDHISVRELSAVDLMKRDFGVDSTFVLDPLFLCPKAEYNSLSQQGNLIYTDKNGYLFSYMLDFNDFSNKVLKYAIQQFNDRAVILTDALEEVKDYRRTEASTNLKVMRHQKVEDFICNLQNSEYYITDSFHGTCLGLIFEKQFVVLANKRGRTRLESLLKVVGLENRLVDSYEQAEKIIKSENKINYEIVNQKLSGLMHSSKIWLLRAIEDGNNTKPMSTYDILDEKIDNISLKLFNLKYNELKAIKSEIDAIKSEIEKIKKSKVQ